MKSRNLIIKKNQKGQAALLIVLITMTLLLFVSLVLTNVVAKRTKMTRDALQSVQAYYLADAGTERLLYLCKGPGATMNPASDLSPLISNQDIDFSFTAGGDGIDDGSFEAVREQSAPILILKITGYYKNTARAVQLSW